MSEIKYFKINSEGEHSFILEPLNQVFPETFVLAIITPANLRPICDCDFFQELVWGSQRITLIITPVQSVKCIATRSSIIILGENIYYVPGSIDYVEIPREIVERIDKIRYYYSIIKELLKRRTLFLLNKDKYNFSFNNIVSIKNVNDLKEYVIELMKKERVAEDIVYYFINENLTTWYLRNRVNK